MDSQQKTAVVTGSSSGIGRAISQDLLSHGYKVIGLARDHKKFDPENKHYFPYEIDLTDFDRTVSLLKRILADHEEVNVPYLLKDNLYYQHQKRQPQSYQII